MPEYVVPTDPELGPVLRELGARLRGHPSARDCAMSIGLRRDGCLTLAAFYAAGSAMLGPNARPARFCIYSITKTLAAICCLRLSEQGLLDIDEPIPRSVVDLELPATLTLAHLLGHRGGLPDYASRSSYQRGLREHPSNPWTEAQFLDVARHAQPGWVPDAGFAYSNLGYLIVRRVIETVAGQSFRAAVATLVAEPLGLGDTFVAENITDWSSCIAGYSSELGGDGLVDVRSSYHPGWCAPGVAVSSVEDTTSLFDRLLAGELLGAAALTRLLALSPVQGAHPPAVVPSYGLGIMGDPAGPFGASFGHAGGGPGYSAAATCVPESVLGRLTAAVFLNRSVPSSALALLVDEVLRCALDHASTDRALEVRRATPADIAGVARVHVVSWQATYRGQVPDAVLAALDPVERAATWKERIAEPANNLFVAVRAGLVIGFTELLPARDTDATPATGEISAIYVDPLHLRTGAGRALLRVAFAVARQRGYRALTLWVLAQNERALAFYRSAGFVADGAQKRVERRSYVLDEVRQRHEL